MIHELFNEIKVHTKYGPNILCRTVQMADPPLLQYTLLFISVENVSH